MAKSAPIGSDFHEDKIEFHPNSRGDQKTTNEDEQSASPESATTPGQLPDSRTHNKKGKKVAKKEE